MVLNGSGCRLESGLWLRVCLSRLASLCRLTLGGQLGSPGEESGSRHCLAHGGHRARLSRVHWRYVGADSFDGTARRGH